MAIHIYRYKFNFVDATRLAKAVPNSPTLNASSPGYVDISVDEAAKPDLDEAMALNGYSYVSTDPANTPTQALAVDIGTASFDIRDVLVWDHFVVGSLATERIGFMGWQVLTSGTGADVVATSEAGHPGIIDFGAGTVAGGRTTLYLGNTSLLNLLLTTGQNELNLEYLVRLNANALIATSNERFILGFGDSFDAAAGGETANGVYLELNPALSPNFQLVTAASAVRTRTDTTLVAAASVWYRVVVRVSFPGGVPTGEILINGVSRCTATATLPGTRVGIGVRMDSNINSAEPRFQIDYCKLTQVTAKET
jgi:hypothetical protein